VMERFPRTDAGQMADNGAQTTDSSQRWHPFESVVCLESVVCRVRTPRLSVLVLLLAATWCGAVGASPSTTLPAPTEAAIPVTQIAEQRSARQRSAGDPCPV